MKKVLAASEIFLGNSKHDLLILWQKILSLYRLWALLHSFFIFFFFFNEDLAFFFYFLLCSITNKLPWIRCISSFLICLPIISSSSYNPPKKWASFASQKERCKNGSRKDTDWPRNLEWYLIKRLGLFSCKSTKSLTKITQDESYSFFNSLLVYL